MVRRFASHWLLASEHNIIPNGGVSFSDDNRVAGVFSLNDVSVEPANTVFVDGWLAPFYIAADNLSAADLRNALVSFAKQNGCSFVNGSPGVLFNFTPQPDGRVVVTKLFPVD